MSRSWVSCCTVALIGYAAGAVLPTSAEAQSQLTTAAGTSSIIADRGFVTLDINQAKIGLHAFRSPTPAHTHIDVVCGVRMPRIEDHTEETADISAAAQAGKRSIISGGEFVPGADASIGVIHVFEHGFEPPQTCPSQAVADTAQLALRSRGYDAVYITLRGSLADRATANPISVTPTVLAFVDHAGGMFGPVLGINHAFTESAILGSSLDVAREWASPGDAQPQTACTLTTVGTLKGGTPAIVEKCAARYLGPLPNDWRSQFRVDYTTKIARHIVGSGPGLGFYAAAAGVARTTAKTSYDLSLGPTLHPSGKPSQILGAALFELTDITDANRQNPMFSQRLSLRLYAALPL